MIESERLQIVAHELRSPVAALTALAEAAPDVPADARRRLVELAIAACRDIERIIGDDDHLALRPELVRVGALVSSFSSDTVAVRSDGDPWAMADPTRLRQAIGNLVGNGLRHGSRVTIEVAERDGSVVVEIADDGPGVDGAIDPFARGTSTVGSTGIGAWLARSVAEAHGGSLQLVPGGPGARFRLVLPSASGAG